MAILKEVRVEQTGALTWDVYIDGRKIDGVRGLTLTMDPGNLPELWLSFVPGKLDMKLDGAVVYNADEAKG